MLSKWKQTISSLSKNEIMVLLFVTSVYVSVYAVAAMMLVYLFYIPLSGQWKKALPAKALDWLLLGFACSALISTLFFSKDGYLFDTLIPKHVFILLSIGILLLCFEIFFFEKTITKRIFSLGLRWMTVLSVTSFLLALFQKIFRIYPDPINRPGRVASVYNNENYYGMVIEFVAVICLYLFFQSKSKKQKSLYFVIFALNLIGLWFCQTRMAFLIIAATAFIFLFFNARKLSYAILSLIGIGSILLLINPSLLPRFDSISSYLDFRLGIWRQAKDAFFNVPLLGRGYYAYSTVWKEAVGTHYPALHAHNLYLESLLNFGIIGSTFLGSYSFIKIFQCIKKCRKNALRLEFSLALCFAVTVILHGLADTTVFWPQTGFFVVFLFIQPNIFNNESKGDSI